MQDFCRLGLKQISKMIGSPLSWYQSAGTALRNPPHLLSRYLQIIIWTHFAAEKLLVQESASKASEHHMLLYTRIVCSHCPF